MGRNQSAVKVAGMRRFQEFRTDETLGETIPGGFAVNFGNLPPGWTEPKPGGSGCHRIDKTCDNAGRLELIWDRPRENAIKVLLLMDSGGSMISYSRLCNQLFTAVNRSNHLRLKVFYFHNCIYDWLYHDPQCSLKSYTPTEYILNTLSSDSKLILVGDASMAIYELMRVGRNHQMGSIQ